MKFFAFSFFIHSIVILLGCFFYTKNSPNNIQAKKSRTQFLYTSDLKAPVKQKNYKTKAKKVLPKKTIVANKQEEAPPSHALNEKVLSYRQELKAFIENSQDYPRQARRLKQSGLVKVQVIIDADGFFKNISLVQNSTFPILDEAALSLLKRLQRFKPLPKNVPAGSKFTIPIAYVM